MPPFWKFLRGYIFLTPPGPKKTFCQKKTFKKVCLPLPLDLTFFKFWKNYKCQQILNLANSCQDAPSSSSSSFWRLRSRTGIMLRCCSWKPAYRTPLSGPSRVLEILLSLPVPGPVPGSIEPPWPFWCFNTCSWYPPCLPASFPEPSTAHKFSNTSHNGRKKVLRWCQLELLTRKTQGAGGQGCTTGQRLDQSMPPSTAHRCAAPPLSLSFWPFLLKLRLHFTFLWSSFWDPWPSLESAVLF